MSKLPVISGEDMVKVLQKLGYVHTRTTGSHTIMKKEEPQGSVVVPVPLHKELAKGTLLSIMRQTNVTRENLAKLIN